jgi:hypothetical protein
VCGELLILGKSVIRYAQVELSAGWALGEPANDGRNPSRSHMICGCLDGKTSMNCFLCGKTSVQVKINLFPFSPEARKMLQKRFGIQSDEALAVCRDCAALPGNLAEKAIGRERDECRRDLIREALKNSRN